MNGCFQGPCLEAGLFKDFWCEIALANGPAAEQFPRLPDGMSDGQQAWVRVRPRLWLDRIEIQNRSTSPIISNITKPRQASSEVILAVGVVETGSAVIGWVEISVTAVLVTCQFEHRFRASGFVGVHALACFDRRARSEQAEA